MAVNPLEFEAIVMDLKNKSLLLSQVEYSPVIGQIIVAISQYENNVLKFKQSQEYSKMLQDLKTTETVN